MKKLVLLSPKDNVAVAAQDIEKGEWCRIIGETTSVVAQEAIAFGHKISLRDIADGELIFKYGEMIARAKGNIMQGRHVHIHNMLGLIE